MASSSNSESKSSYDISLSIGGLDTRTQFTEFKCSYDIFLSFRGLDTRTKFTDHLYEALKREGFETFRDNEGIERGENIYSELQKAIWNSSMSVIVLSKTYATSKSCLFEIQTILEHRKKNSDHVILPVFYEVDPSEIKEQAKKLDFGEKKKVTVEEVEGWSAALKEVASMGGMVCGNQSNRSEAKFIEEIIGVLKVKQADKHLRDLDENMQNLKRKVEYLSGQKNDINSQIDDEWRPGIRPKKEVKVWLTNVQRFKDDVQRLEQEVVGETNVSSRTRLGKVIANKILEVQELQKKASDFNSLMIDEFPTCRPLLTSWFLFGVLCFGIYLLGSRLTESRMFPATTRTIILPPYGPYPNTRPFRASPTASTVGDFRLNGDEKLSNPHPTVLLQPR